VAEAEVVASLIGLPVSPGRAAGPLLRMGEPVLLVDVHRPDVDDPAHEGELAVAALNQVGDALASLAAGASATAAAVLEAESMMAQDPGLHEAVVERAAAGMPAAWAVDAAIAETQAVFRDAGGFLAERVADLEDIRNRAIAYLLGRSMPGVPRGDEPFVLAADDLAPADTAGLDPEVVLAMVTEHGGITSHTAILARSLGIPAVVSCSGILGVAEGTLVGVDGATGVVELDLAKEVVVERQQLALAARVGLAADAGPGRTADGHPVKLLLNIGGADDLAGPAAAVAEGVGLFRTEFLFLGRLDAPTLQEQEAAYRAVFEAAAGRKIVVRTLDAGADKPLPFLGLGAEPNPALGIRGLRISRSQPDVLTHQLDALARAAQATGADAWVMAPMVSTRAEAESFVTTARARGLPVAGVMIEVPAAALRAAQILEVVDFLSIGTNDLSQYTLAADRQNGDLADLLDPWQPALLSLIGACGAAGLAAGKQVGVCGEAASDPLLALVLVGLDVTSLSMSARSIPAVHASLAAHTLEECRQLAALAVDAADHRAGRAAVRAAAHPT
jgi:phosphoenolpyruvate-protein phosphotransferase (PTS system enzyme I)